MVNVPVACQDFVCLEHVYLQESVVIEHVAGEYMRLWQAVAF